MDLLEALADDVSLKDFFMTWAPKLFEARREDFAASSDIDLVICFKFQDTGEIYTVEMSANGLVVEDDEMIDFPALTVLGYAKYWPKVREALRPISAALDARRSEVSDRYALTEAMYGDWEKFDVVIDIKVEDGQGETVELSVVLNDYDVPDSARRFGFSLPLSALNALADGSQEPEDVGKSLRISGDVRVAATLGGMILSHQQR